jgi:hypothetical protein
MAGTNIVRFLSSRMLRRDEPKRLAELRQRDGDNCRRCRRPMGFDLPRGHDQAPSLVPIGSSAPGGRPGIDDWCLCHGRCNGQTVDATSEVQERMRLRA